MKLLKSIFLLAGLFCSAVVVPASCGLKELAENLTKKNIKDEVLKKDLDEALKSETDPDPKLVDLVLDRAIFKRKTFIVEELLENWPSAIVRPSISHDPPATYIFTAASMGDDKTLDVLVGAFKKHVEGEDEDAELAKYVNHASNSPLWKKPKPVSPLASMLDFSFVFKYGDETDEKRERAAIKCTKILVGAGADIHWKDVEGKSILDYAVTSRIPKIVDLILSQPKPPALSSDPSTLGLAVYNLPDYDREDYDATLEIALRVIKHMGDDIKTIHQTPRVSALDVRAAVTRAIVNGEIKVVEALLGQGLNLDFRGTIDPKNEQNSLLYLALRAPRENRESMVDLLKDAKGTLADLKVVTEMSDQETLDKLLEKDPELKREYEERKGELPVIEPAGDSHGRSGKKPDTPKSYYVAGSGLLLGAILIPAILWKIYKRRKAAKEKLEAELLEEGGEGLAEPVI